jgi:hypothetical protein
MKGDKYFQTRTVGKYGYGDGSFCTTICLGDWWAKHGTRAIDHFGRIHEPIRLAPENAWIKDYSYHYVPGQDNSYTHYFKNKLTNEQIPLTLAQYNDNDYTLERARQT